MCHQFYISPDQAEMLQKVFPRSLRGWEAKVLLMRLSGMGFLALCALQATTSAELCDSAEALFFPSVALDVKQAQKW